MDHHALQEVGAHGEGVVLEEEEEEEEWGHV